MVMGWVTLGSFLVLGSLGGCQSSCSCFFNVKLQFLIFSSLLCFFGHFLLFCYVTSLIILHCKTIMHYKVSLGYAVNVLGMGLGQGDLVGMC